jgi:diguanylate cyclase (GGDEF)-like protein
VRWPRRLRLAVDLSLVVDAAWATAVAAASGGSLSPLVGLYLVTALWAALGYSARTGVKGGILASLGYLTLVWFHDGQLWSAASLGALGLFWAVLASAVMGAAAGERELRVRAERLAVLHDAAHGLLRAVDGEEMISLARTAAAGLLPGWRPSVRLGAAAADVRLVRAGDEGVVVVPVVVDDRAVGAIECRRLLPRGRVRHRVRQREIAALETLSAGLGSALWRAELVAGIERLSLTDALTGIGNRRAFDAEMERRLATARREGGEVALCLMDIDHFKAFNDTFGHVAGDEAIARVARVVRETCRASDIPARYGGEEIAVIMPGLGAQGALEAAERIRAAVAAATIGARDVTVSVGVAVSVAGCSAEVLVEAADRALYAAKAAGRNRVFSGSTAGPAADGSVHLAGRT